HLLGSAIAIFGLVIGLAFATRGAGRSRPTLERVGPLALAGRFDLALGCVDAYLRVYPTDPRARLMAAELALEAPTPRPDLAMDHLRRFESGDRGLLDVSLLDKGKAAYLMERFDRAEAFWKKALAWDPRVPEAAWALLDLYYMEGRTDDARKIALRQQPIEPDRKDRARMLLELVRQDA